MSMCVCVHVRVCTCGTVMRRSVKKKLSRCESQCSGQSESVGPRSTCRRLKVAPESASGHPKAKQKLTQSRLKGIDPSQPKENKQKKLENQTRSGPDQDQKKKKLENQTRSGPDPDQKKKKLENQTRSGPDQDQKNKKA